MEISKQVQEEIRQFQALQQQLQLLLAQKYQLDLRIRETQNAIKELEKTEEKEIYKAVGRILVRSKKEKVKSELSDSKETMGLRIKTLESQEKKLREKVTEMQKKIESALGPAG